MNVLKKDSLGSVISHPINSKEIKISKNHGLTCFFNLDSFPEKAHFYDIQGITNPNHGEQPYMTRKQIYNFDIRKKSVEQGWVPDYYFDTIYEYKQEKK